MNSLTEKPVKIDKHLVTLLGRHSPEVEQYRALRHALEVPRNGAAPRVVAVTSPAVGDGKTTTAINLAGVLAYRREARILLVDADLRRPSVAPLLGLATDGDQAGLIDALVEPDLTLERVVTHLSAFNLWVLPAGRLRLSADPFELLRTPRMGELLEHARRQYEFVVLDTSPLLLVPDSRILENLVDAFLLVIAAHRTPRKLIGEALDLLSPSKLIRLVFNGADLSGYYAYGYSSSRPGVGKNRVRWH